MNGNKVIFVKEDSVDTFRNNDDIVSYLSQKENLGKIQEEKCKNASDKKSGCFARFGVLALILTILLI